MNGQRDRKEVLERLLKCPTSIEGLLARLADFPWDCDTELVVLRSSHLVAVLDRYLTGKLSAKSVEAWADAIECRDDIGLDREHAGVLREDVFTFATTEVKGQLSPTVAQNMVARYRKAG